MTDTTTGVEPGTRDLLAAIRDALTVPHPARFTDNDQALRVLMNRAAGVRGVLNAIIDGRALPEHGVTPIRTTVADYPVRYPAYQLPEQDGGAR